MPALAHLNSLEQKCDSGILSGSKACVQPIKPSDKCRWGLRLKGGSFRKELLSGARWEFKNDEGKSTLS